MEGAPGSPSCRPTARPLLLLPGVETGLRCLWKTPAERWGVPVPGCLRPCSYSLHKLALACFVGLAQNRPLEQGLGTKVCTKGAGAERAAGAVEVVATPSFLGNSRATQWTGRCPQPLFFRLSSELLCPPRQWATVPPPGQAWTLWDRLSLPPCVLLSISCKCRAGTQGANGLRCPAARTHGRVCTYPGPPVLPVRQPVCCWQQPRGETSPSLAIGQMALGES